MPYEYDVFLSYRRYGEWPEWVKNVFTPLFYRLEFRPTLDSIVDLALLVIKYDAASDWISAIIDLLVESFEASRRFDRPVRFSVGFRVPWEGIRSRATVSQSQSVP